MSSLRHPRHRPIWLYPLARLDCPEQSMCSTNTGRLISSASHCSDISEFLNVRASQLRASSNRIPPRDFLLKSSSMRPSSPIVPFVYEYEPPRSARPSIVLLEADNTMGRAPLQLSRTTAAESSARATFRTTSTCRALSRQAFKIRVPRGQPRAINPTWGASKEEPQAGCTQALPL